MLGKSIWNGRKENRVGPRKQEFSAGALYDLDDARTVHCLIRNTSDQGAQLRLGGAGTVAPGSWLLHLKNNMAFRLFPVWRRPSLIGAKLTWAHAVDDTLPPHLAVLKNAMAYARLHHANCVTAQGVCTRDQQDLLAASYSSWGMTEASS